MTDNNPTSQDEQYAELQRIYLDWHHGKRPLSGYIHELDDYITAHYPPKTEQQPESVAAWMKSLGFEYDPNGYGNAEYWRVIDGKLDMYVTAEQAVFFHRVQHQQVVESTEQQAVGGEDVRQDVQRITKEPQLYPKLGGGYSAQSPMTDAIMQLISRHYIAKKAVDAVLQEDIEIFEDVPENTRLRLLQLGHNLGVKDFRTALGLDSDHSPTPPDHSQCVSREAVQTAVGTIGEPSDYSKFPPHDVERMKGYEFGVIETKKQVLSRLNLDSGTEGKQ